jgi:hypothetical protein
VIVDDRRSDRCLNVDGLIQLFPRPSGNYMLPTTARSAA